MWAGKVEMSSHAGGQAGRTPLGDGIAPANSPITDASKYLGNKWVGLSYKLPSCPCSGAPRSNKRARSRSPCAPCPCPGARRMAISHSRVHVEEGERVSDREGTSVCLHDWVPSQFRACRMCSLQYAHRRMHASRLPTQTAARHAHALYSSTLGFRLGFRPAQACTRIHASIPRPCHPHPDNSRQPVPPNPYRKPIQTFPCQIRQTKQTTPCSRLAAAATAQTGKKLKWAATCSYCTRQVKNLISLARLVSSLFTFSRSLSLPLSLGPSDASPVFTLLCYQNHTYISPDSQAVRQSVNRSGHPASAQSKRLSSPATQRRAYATVPVQTAAAPAFCHYCCHCRAASAPRPLQLGLGAQRVTPCPSPWA